MKKFVPLIVGLVFVGVGIFMYSNNQRLAKVCTVETEAVVVDMKEELQSDSDVTGYIYYPIVEYRAGDEKIETTMSMGSSTPAYRIGERIDILYNPDKVTEFIVKDDKSSNILSYILIGAGILVTVLGVVTLFKKEV